MSELPNTQHFEDDVVLDLRQTTDEDSFMPGPIPGHPAHLPQPPTVIEKYSYLGKQPKWTWVWLFISQLGIVYGFVMVMIKGPDTVLGLIFLTFMVPPIFVNFWLRMKRRRLGLDEHKLRVRLWRYETPQRPSVDVFLPSCGEELDVLDNTFRHVAQLDWDGPLRIHVLDDADLPEVKTLAEGHGFAYVVRPNRGELKKAGNLIHAYEHTNGEFMVVFDADFVPRSDFLWETMPYMDDQRTGVVQTAQYFPSTGVNYIARYAGALQELFFRWIQPARDTHQAAICAGTNVVYRRAAVAAAGGFARVPLGEDVHSGVKIWTANYATRYLPLVLAQGIAPDSFDALTNQQYRWCRSSMLLMISGFFKSAPFGWQQRLSFWAAFLYYMASASLIFTSTLPTLIMVWFYPAGIHPVNYLPLLPSLFSIFIFRRLARGWNLTIYRVATINSFCHLLAVTDALRARVQAWVPTGATKKGKKANVPKRIALLLRGWIVLTQGLLWTSVIRNLLGDYSVWSYLPTIALGLLQAYMLLPFLWRLDPKKNISSSDFNIDIRDHKEAVSA